MRKEIDELLRQADLSRETALKIAYQCAADTFTRLLEKSENDADIEAAEHYYLLVKLYKELRDDSAVRLLTPEDFDSDLPDADGALPCWMEVSEKTRQAWIQQYGFEKDTVFSGWTTVKRNEIGNPEDGCTYWTGQPKGATNNDRT